MNWDDLRYFLAVLRRGSHKGAGRLLGVAPTTVSRRLLALEAGLGVKLFQRTPERLLPTPAAHALIARAERIEAEVTASQRELDGASARMDGPLRVTAGDGLINHLVLPALGQLLRAHPGLVIELRAETRVLDLARREADLAVRLVRPREPALIAKALGPMRFALFGSEAYFDRRGTPRTFEALGGHDWIGFDETLDRLPQVQWLRRKVTDLRYVVRANTTTAQVRACAEGHGLALLPVFTARGEPRLRRLFPRQEGPVRELWGVSHADLRGNVKIASFLTWLARLVLDANDDAPAR
jgi:DNA-binding transcriptional LysR family regulator